MCWKPFLKLGMMVLTLCSYLFSLQRYLSFCIMRIRFRLLMSYWGHSLESNHKMENIFANVCANSPIKNFAWVLYWEKDTEWYREHSHFQPFLTLKSKLLFLTPLLNESKLCYVTHKQSCLIFHMGRRNWWQWWWWWWLINNAYLYKYMGYGHGSPEPCTRDDDNSTWYV